MATSDELNIEYAPSNFIENITTKAVNGKGGSNIFPAPIYAILLWDTTLARIAFM